MSDLFEYSDRLNSPVEAFYCDRKSMLLPVDNHWHYFAEILFMIKGSVIVSCNENTFRLESGMMLLIPPQCIHCIYCDGEKDYYYTCVKFDINRIQLIEDYLPRLSSQFQSVLQLNAPPLLFPDTFFPDLSLQDIFTRIIEEVAQKHYGYHTYIYSLLSGILLRILRSWYDAGIPMADDPVTDADTYSIQDVVLYIDKHSSENINITKLAAMCNMSYSYFAKVFHRQYGQNCKQYIEFIRLSKAENLILFTDYDLAAIAEETGFADCSHLIRCFKRRYHTTPKQYRLQHRNP